MVSEAKLKATKETGLKILTSKQMLQRLSIALAQVKVGNNLKKIIKRSKENCLFFVSTETNY